MSICECPTCQEVKGAVSPVKDQCETCRKTFPACNGTITIMPQTGHLDCLSWMPKKPAPNTTEPEKLCETCFLEFGCKRRNEKRCQTEKLEHWREKPSREKIAMIMGDPDTFVNRGEEDDREIDHAALAAEHWDGYTGPMVDCVAEAVKKISQLGGEEDETDKAIDAVVKAFQFVALSHWEHGAKHEREAK